MFIIVLSSGQVLFSKPNSLLTGRLCIPDYKSYSVLNLTGAGVFSASGLIREEHLQGTPDTTITKSPGCDPPPVPGITGNESPCSGNITYVYITEPGMISYSWDISPNGSIIGGSGTNSVSVSWSTSGPGTISVNYVNSNGCTAAYPTVMDIDVHSNPLPAISITPSVNTVCSGTPVTYTAVPVNGGTTPGFEWKVNNIIVSANSTIYTYVPVNGDVVSCQLTSSLPCSNGVTVNSNQLNMIVNSNSPVSLNITPASNPICQGLQETLTAQPVNGGTNPGYQWKVNGFASGSNNPVFTYLPQNDDVVVCTLLSSLACATGNPATSNSVELSVSSDLPVHVAISASENPVCSGTPVTFNAVPENGGINPTYQWKVNGGSSGNNSPVFIYTPVQNDIITCVMVSNITCPSAGNTATSNSVTMTVRPLSALTVAITPSVNPVCQGSTVTLTATCTNGGSTPVYLWNINGFFDGSGPTLTYFPGDNDVIRCYVTSSLDCVTGNPAESNEVTMHVNAGVTSSISITPSSNPVCEGTTVTFTAAIVNGGANPQYHWKLNGVGLGTNSPVCQMIPSNNDILSCELVPDVSCFTPSTVISSPILMSVSSLHAVGISIETISNLTCLGEPVTIVATGLNGGFFPIYQWHVNTQPIGGNSPTLTYPPGLSDQVNCTLTSNLNCIIGNPATSNTLVPEISQQLPVSVSIETSSDHVCEGENVSFTATGINGGSAPVYHWMVNDINIISGGPTFSYQPSSNDIVSCQLVSNLLCASGNPANSNTIPIIVNSIQAVSLSIISSANPVCQETVVTFTSSSTNEGSSPLYKWYVNGNVVGTNSPTYSYFPLDGDVVTCKLTSNIICPSSITVVSNSLTMNVYSDFPPTISIVASQNPVCQGNSITFTATTANGGYLPVYQWTVNGVNVGTNTNTYSYVPINQDVVRCKLTSSNTCSLTNTVTSNPLVMNIIPRFELSVNISASANPVCVGTPVCFIANAVAIGTIEYQWKINNVNVGTNSTMLNYTPINGDKVVCWINTSASCIVGNGIVESNEIKMDVNSQLPVSVSISASQNPVCLNQPVTIQATPGNGGSFPIYQWNVNGNISGSNTSSYTYVPVNGDLISCKMSSSLSCAWPDTASSNQVLMNVTTPKTVRVDISSSMNPACPGTFVTFHAIPTNGGTSPVFQWMVNGVISGTNSSTFTYLPLANDIITCKMTSNMTCIAGNPATSNAITMSVTTGFPVSVTITALLNPFCLGTPVQYTAIPVNGGSAPVYQWMVNGMPVGTNSPILVYYPEDDDLVLCIMNSSWSCAIGNPATSNEIQMKVIDEPNSSVTLLPSQTSVCIGTPVTYTAVPQQGGPTPYYRWYVNNDSITGVRSPTYQYVPNNSDFVKCTMKSSLGCVDNPTVTSNVVQMTVNPITDVSVTISPSTNGTCQQTPVMFTAVPDNGGTNPSYSWIVNRATVGGNMETLTYVPVNNDSVTCILTSNAFCPPPPVKSNIVVMTVYPETPDAVTITPSENPSCTGSAVTFTAVPINVYSTSVYEWRVNNVMVGGNEPTFSYVPTNDDDVTCTFYSNGVCYSGFPVISNAVEMMVDDLVPINVAITTASEHVCAGSQVTFTSHVFNGSSNLTYQWLVNGIPEGTNTPSFDFIPVNGDQVMCRVQHTLTCSLDNPVFSNAVIMTVDPMVQAGITIQAASNPVCSGSPIQLTATPINGGSIPTYQWNVNNVNVGTSSPFYSYIPTNTNSVTCKITSNADCLSSNIATSTPLIVTVNPYVQVFVSISASSNPACDNKEVVFTANPVNGGNTPVYQWKVNGINSGINNQHLTIIPHNNDVVSCQLTSNAGCPNGNPYTSNPVTMVVTQSLPAQVVVTPTANPVCQGTNVQFSALAGNGGNSPGYQWMVNSLPVGTNCPTLSYVPVNGDIVKCIMTSTALCSTNNPATSVPVTMNVSSSLPVSVSVTPSSNPSCLGSLVSYTATPVNGGITPAYQWRVNDIMVGSNLPTFSYTPSQNDVVTCYISSSFTCATGNPAVSLPVQMQIHTSVNPGILITGSANPVCQGTTVNYSANPTSPGTNPVYQWKVNNIIAGTNSSAFSFQPADNDMITCLMQSSEICAITNPVLSNSIMMRVSAEKPVSITIAPATNPVCMGNPATFTATPVNGGISPQFLWKVNNVVTGGNAPSLNYLPAEGDRVTCQLTSAFMCATGNPAISDETVMHVSSTLPVDIDISASSNPSCMGAPVAITANPVNGGSVPVYEWKRNGFTVGPNQQQFTFTPSNHDVITCQLTSNNSCASGNPATSAPLTMTVVSIMTPAVDISSSSNPVCPGTLVSYTASGTNSGSSPSYQWYVNNVPSGTNSDTYSYTPVQGDVVMCKLTANESCAVGNPASSNPISMVVSGNLPVSLSITVSSNNICQGTSVSFSSASLNGGPFPAYQWKVNGTDAGTNNSTYSYSPANNDVVTCQLTSSLSCSLQNPASSNSINMAVSPMMPVTLAITPSAATVCQGTSVTYTTTQANGGTFPVFQWKLNGSLVGTNSPVYSCIPNNGDVVTCSLKSDVVCASNNPATSNALSAVVFPIPSINFSGCFDPVTRLSAPSFKLKGGLPLGGTYSGPGVDPLTDTFHPDLAGTGVKTITYSYSNSGNCNATTTRTINVLNDTVFSCGNNLFDFRDANNPMTYPTIQIGTQCWMASNLNYGTLLQASYPQTDNCQVEKYCYNDNVTNCALKGGLYQWDELLRYTTGNDKHGICPTGWHIPDEQEWQTLFNFYGGQQFAGQNLMASDTPTGFFAVPAGVRYIQPNWIFDNFATFFWSTTFDTPTKVSSHAMNVKDKSISHYSSSRGNAFSVRCIKD